MKNNRIIIAGSRSCPEGCSLIMARIRKILLHIDPGDIEIVSGGCRGADILGENYAKDNGLTVKRFPADWDKYGKGAGYVRNKAMAEYGTHLIALWDGVSRGTAMMVDLAKDKGLKIRIIKI